MKFIDSLSMTTQTDLDRHVQECLYEDWSNSHADEGEDYLENKIMQFASDDLKQQYNEYYGYIEGDEFLL